MNHIGDVIARVVSSSAVDRASIPGHVKPKTNTIIQLIVVVSTISTQHHWERTKTGWLGISIMYLSETTCLSVDCCLQWASTMKILLSVLV